MSTAKKRLLFLVAALGLTFGIGVYFKTLGDAQAQGAKGKGKTKETDANAPDRAAIEKSVRSFIEAFEKGDAKAVAAHWTENGEYVADDGVTFRGRDAIEKEYQELFKKRKGKVKIDIDVESIRFPSKDTAIEEGHFLVRADKLQNSASKYSVLHVREGGKWLMAVVREWPAAGASIRDLDWLIGTWAAKRDDAEVNTTYEWWGEKNFIRVNFSIKTKGKSITGFQMIGKDASTGGIRSWAFDPDGSFGEATWTREGKKWLQEAAAVLPDGSVHAATHIITQIDQDSFTFQSVERTNNGEAAPDIAPIKVMRVK